MTRQICRIGHIEDLSTTSLLQFTQKEKKNSPPHLVQQEMAGVDRSRRSSSSPPPLPWTVRVQLAALSAAHRSDGSARRLLFYLGDLHAAASPRPDAAGVRSVDVTIDASRGLWARVFCPPTNTAAAKLPVVVYFHGGGFVLFSAASRPYDALCRRISRGDGAVVVSVNYRLAPEHRFPAAYDDGLAALRYLDANGLAEAAAELGAAVDLSRCFLAGDSAGGNIAHHVAQRWASSPSSPPASLRLAGAVLISPFFGGEERTEEEVGLDKASLSLSLARTDYFWREFLPEGATRDHAAARVCGGERVELAEAFPPAMVVIGGFDLLKGWQARYVAALREKGKAVRVVEYPDAIHGFHAFPELADSGKLVEEMKLFVQEHSSNHEFL
ncbi:probable carboxylesterase 18 [Oryza glaberrima]|uniref:probable carboxylesterase 18 n=1 Tax=Oryza glaberrima TaxID=4538 RepID=UPI00224C0887|nr:probable carboxylesterase 18 [Oryza glaberrima]